MQFFQDSAGNKYELTLTIGDVLRVKKASGGKYDLFEPQKEYEPGMTLMGIVQADFEAFFEVFWHLIEPQAIEKNITAVQFGKLMAADCLFAAQVAFAEEWTLFFQNLQRPEIVATLEKTARLMGVAKAKLKAGMNSQQMQEIEALAETKMDKALNDSLGSLREQLES